MADDHETKTEAAQAPDVTPSEPQDPPRAPAADPTAVARQAVAEQKFTELQSQIAQLTQQQGAVVQALTQRQQQEFEQELASLTPAERAERRSQMLQQQVAGLQQQIARGTAPQGQSSEEYFRSRSREIEEQVNRDLGLDEGARVKIGDVPQDILQAGPKPTEAWMRTEAENRKARKSQQSSEEQVSAAVRRELAAAGVAAPAGRASAGRQDEVTHEDYHKVAWQGVGKGSGGPTAAVGRAMGLHGMGQGKIKAQLQELRDRAYQEAGMGS